MSIRRNGALSLANLAQSSSSDKQGEICEGDEFRRGRRVKKMLQVK